MAFHTLSFKSCFQQAKVLPILYTTASHTVTEESLFRVSLYSSSLSYYSLKEIIKVPLENTKVTENSNVFLGFKLGLRKLKKDIREALYNTSYNLKIWQNQSGSGGACL